MINFLSDIIRYILYLFIISDNFLLLQKKQPSCHNKVMFRIGYGVDAHQLVDGRPLILGGVVVPFDKGLLGHSDADVLTHTIMDALLGALSLGSIGDHFPDHDPAYKDANSIQLLKQVFEYIQKKDYGIVNIDSVIVAQAPKLKPYIYQIRENLANHLSLDIDDISVKATTTEHMGPEGRLEGMSAHATVLLQKKNSLN